MLTSTVSDNVVFAYRDSGPPLNDGYLTVIIVHGLGSHSGLFQRMIDSANPLGYRLIAPNRRPYPGSTPYTETETAALQPGAPIADFSSTLERQGLYLLQFVDNMVREHALTRVALVGWSMGTLFLMATAAAITQVPDDVKGRLTGAIKALIAWDPPHALFGFAHPPTDSGWEHPLVDTRFPPPERPKNFFAWVKNYFPHPDLASRRFDRLVLEAVPDPPRPPTLKGATPEELESMTDRVAARRGDLGLGSVEFGATMQALLERAFLRGDARDMWGEVPSALMYGDANAPTIVWASWQLEALAESLMAPLTVKILPGENHFPMIDNIPLAFEAISSCVKG